MTSPSAADLVHIIVVGNEKGGAGKTTSAMHLIASLLDKGHSVASMDVDSRQQSLSHYLQNRHRTIERTGIAFPCPVHHVLPSSTASDLDAVHEEDTHSFNAALSGLLYAYDFIVIDTPGSNSFLSQLAHSYADTLVTPINDSFVDLDVLAKVEAETHKITGPGIYSDMVWKQKMVRAGRDKRSIQWIVMRNRLSNIDAKNKRYMADVLEKLAQRIGFRHAPGLSERVIFRELFLHGLTLLDLTAENSPIQLSLSHVAARQELREFLSFLQLPQKTQNLTESSLCHF